MAPSTSAKSPNGKNSKPSSSKTTSKDKVGKVNSSKISKTAEQQKKEVKENIRKLQLILDNLRTDPEAYKETLDELTKAYGNGAHPEHKDEYERKTKELNDMERTLQDYEADLNELMAEQKGLEDMGGVEKTGGSMIDTSGPSNLGSDPPGLHGSLFVNPNAAGSSDPISNEFANLILYPTDPPVINITDEGSPNTDADDEDAGWFTPEQNKVVTGRSDDGIVVAWRKHGSSKQVIIRRA